MTGTVVDGVATRYEPFGVIHQFRYLDNERVSFSVTRRQRATNTNQYAALSPQWRSNYIFGFAPNILPADIWQICT